MHEMQDGSLLQDPCTGGAHHASQLCVELQPPAAGASLDQSVHCSTIRAILYRHVALDTGNNCC